MVSQRDLRTGYVECGETAVTPATLKTAATNFAAW